MKHLKQDKPKNCGQTCVAIIAGIDIEKSEKIFGHSTSTRTSMVKKALYKLGFKSDKRMKRCDWDSKLPPQCIIRVHFIPKETYTHFIVYDLGWIYDPAQNESFPLHHYKKYMESRLKLTSYLEITEYS